MADNTCFVVMGFGKKTDYTTGRTLDLDKTYKYLIKPVLERKNWKCVRADEILNTGSIDEQMYLELLNADVVIADLSTTNANAIYELGIRHALRPFSTILIAEDKLTVYPFDFSHISITKYTHLGDSIDYGEAERFHGELDKLLDAIIAQKPRLNDSPVYTFIKNLVPPSIERKIKKAAKKSMNAVEQDTSTNNTSQKTLSLLCAEGEEAITNKNFAEAKGLFQAALALKKNNDVNNTDANLFNNDPYIIHRLVFATYKDKSVNTAAALNEALETLSLLDLEHTNDPETVALAASIEKKLFENNEGDEHLKNAIFYNERGYFLLNNRFNGINLAYAFNCRVNTSLFTKKEDKIADMIFANRVRTRVLLICEKDWDEIVKLENNAALTISKAGEEDIQKHKEYINTQKFWILVNKAEAHFGLGNFKEYRQAVAEAEATNHAEWMYTSFMEQLEKLKVLLNKYGNLLETPWIYEE